MEKENTRGSTLHLDYITARNQAQNKHFIKSKVDFYLVICFLQAETTHYLLQIASDNDAYLTSLSVITFIYNRKIFYFYFHHTWHFCFLFMGEL